MNDMSSVIVPKSDQINSDDLIAGPMTITIRDVQIKGGQEQPVSIFFDGSEKAFRPCKSMSRVLVQAWGADAKAYIGRSLTLYRDPTVKWGGLEVGGIRISHMSDIDGVKQMMLTATKGSRKPHKVMPLVMEKPAATDDQQALALAAITDAANNGTEALANVWKQKWMAPHRDALQLDLDRLKVVAAGNDKVEPERPAEQSPEVNDEAPHPAIAKADALIASFKNATSEPALAKLHKDAAFDIAAMPDEIAAAVENAYAEAGKRLKAPESVA